VENLAMSQQEMVSIDPLGTASVNERVRAILNLTRQLTDLILSETSLLKTRRAAALRETEAEKNRLSSLYAREMRAIQMRPELLAGASAEQKSMLKRASTEFRDCVVTHVRALARIRAVSEGLVVAIGEELDRMRKPVTSYKGPGGPRMKNTGAIPQSAAFGYDRSI